MCCERPKLLTVTGVYRVMVLFLKSAAVVLSVAVGVAAAAQTQQAPAPIERQAPGQNPPAATAAGASDAQPQAAAYPAQPQSGYPPPPPGAYPAESPVTPSVAQPPGAAEAIAQLTSQPSSHTAFTFDRDMLRSMLGTQAAGLSSIVIQNFRFHEPAFYVPEELAALGHAYNAAGWKHLVEAHASPREQATPAKPITDLWLHFHGAEIDDVAVLIRAPRQMNLIEVSGMLRPLDLAHLGGHFGLPRVDPDAVMVPAPAGR